MSPKDFLPTNISRQKVISAARLALQSSLAAALTFSAMEALSLPEKFIGILGAIFVMQPSVGNTFGQATSRVLATLVGSGVGVACLFALPDGYGTAAALGISVFVMNAIAGLRPDWAYGVIAAVALALRSGDEPLQVVQDRAIAIALGAAIGVLIAMTIWPDRAKNRAQRHLAAALRAAGDSLDNAIKGLSGAGQEASDARSRYNLNIETARGEAEGIRFGNRQQMEEKVSKTERLYNSVLILNRIAEDTTEAASARDGLDEHVRTVQVCGHEIAHGLADGDFDQQARLDEIRSALASARKLVSYEADDAELHVYSSALIFGLNGVAESLSGLIEAMQPKEKPAPKAQAQSA
ncbi:FUSC family protein [Henriciella sp.]|uniref:FUSC family protein n=1 Tax=Henriciella sp. TaxID=1968823 RepID=UPI00260BB83B|nr:FUSC family protein [Henriciella sp.]